MDGPGATASRAHWLLASALLIVVIALRFVALGSDPMPELDFGFISDAGTWWKNPRLHAIWGVWKVDDGNFGLLTGPSHMLAVRASFALFGVGYAQAYAVNAVSGVLLVTLLYAMVRREASPRAALLAAALLGINLLSLAYDRSAYPESFQVLMVTSAIAAILHSSGRRWLAALGGVAVTVALLAKPPGLVLAPVATATWLAPWIMHRWFGSSRRVTVRDLAPYFLTAGALTVAVGILFVAPNAEDIWLHFQRQMSEGAYYGSLATDRLLIFGTRLGFRLNGFFRHEWYLLLVTAVFGATRVARINRRPVTTLEIAAWIWLLLGMGIMGLQTYQQDRRFLFLIPALSILCGLALAESIELGETHWRSARGKRIGSGVAAGIVAFAVLFFLMPKIGSKAVSVLGLSRERWTVGLAGGLLLSLAAVSIGGVVCWRPLSVRWRGKASTQLLVMLAPVLFVLVRACLELTNRGTGLRDVSRALDRISAAWPADERVATGWSAGTLTMGSGVLPVNQELKGLRAAERFRPQLELYAAATGTPLKRSDYWAVPGRPQKVECAQYPVWPERSGRARITVYIFVEPDRVDACRTAVAASDLPSP